MSEIGHNSTVGGIAADALSAFVDRIENLEEEKQAIASDIRDVYAEAKGSGFDVKVLRSIIAMRRKSTEALQEERHLQELYGRALKMSVFD